MTAPVPLHSPKWLQHFTESEYNELLARAPFPSQAKNDKRLGRKDAIARWPDLAEWCHAPLAERLAHWPVGATTINANEQSRSGSTCVRWPWTDG
ncbi:hypothetical protein ACQP1G_21605 [Nocardia sp. CA-107356]|uniref:hypothetical protein n=1 Tax=Nocardia sp. CA-107356 TaxID=3239972 RepID=UPI003D91C8D4